MTTAFPSIHIEVTDEGHAGIIGARSHTGVGGGEYPIHDGYIVNPGSYVHVGALVDYLEDRVKMLISNDEVLGAGVVGAIADLVRGGVV